MKTSLKGILTVAIAILLISAEPPADNKYLLTKGYAVTIHGTSNMHDWDEKVETVTGNGIIEWNSDGSFNLDVLSIVMNVRSIKSDKGATMDNNTYKALKSESHPEIEFVLKTPLKSINVGKRSISAVINLSIAGVTKAVDMVVTSTPNGQNSVTFEGSKTIKMTDYGIDPPKALMGMLKTGNEITIHFKTIFLKK